MTKFTYGERVGKNGKLAVGCSAFVLDESAEKVLLVKRSDNGRWAVPGGYMDAGETLHEACEREVLEETGLKVEASHLISVYSDPNLLLEYADGNKWQLVVLHFWVGIFGGQLTISEETTKIEFFSFEEAKALDISKFDLQRIEDGFNFIGETSVKSDIDFLAKI